MNASHIRCSGGLHSAGAGFYRVVCLVMMGLVVGGVRAEESAGELIVGGDFGSLDGWQFPQILKGHAGEIIPENSPFTNVYPSNTSCIRLPKDDEVPTGNIRYLKQDAIVAPRRVVLSADFKLLSEDTQRGFAIVLRGEGNAVLFAASLRKVLALGLNSTGERGRGIRWQLPQKTTVASGIWYQLECTIDLDRQSLDGTLRSEGGDSIEIKAQQPPVIDPASPEAAITEISIEANAGRKNLVPPILLDNISLRPSELR